MVKFENEWNLLYLNTIIIFPMIELFLTNIFILFMWHFLFEQITSEIQDNINDNVYNMVSVQCISSNIFATKEQEISIYFSQLKRRVHTVFITKQLI
jgi:hypothetical protein